jgi:hypothetical protein
MFWLTNSFTIRSTLITLLVVHNRPPSLGSVLFIIYSEVRMASLFSFAHNTPDWPEFLSLSCFVMA